MGGLKVLAAMSGGVDSATAAARAVDAGHEVTGVHLALSSNPKSYRTGARGCCTLEDARDARRAADVIGIPFYVWDMAERFHRDVVEDFVAEYAAGRTPNPCLRCNEKIKFAAVLDRALALGFDAVCTGHYARVCDGALRRAADAGKDQSYVLAVLTSAQLGHAMFPLGDTPKAQVRTEAARRGLAVADKPDSHDVCFIPDGDTKEFLTRHLGQAPGRIVDQSGAVIGEHEGTYAFTVGQRRGLRVGRPAADGRPRYVLDIEPVTKTVTVGPAAALDISDITAGRPVWTGCAPPALPVHCQVQLSAHGRVSGCTAWLDEEALRIRLHHPVRGVAKGQAAVLYDGDSVLGSGTITAASLPPGVGRHREIRSAAGISARHLLVVFLRQAERRRYVSDVHDELIPVGRENGDGQPHGRAGLVQRHPEQLEDLHPAVRGDLEEVSFGRVGDTHRDPVAVPDLLQAEGIREILRHPFLDVVRADQPCGAAGDEGGTRGRDSAGRKYWRPSWPVPSSQR
jgi:tRNA-uridine 2-sulfurtransferase